MTNEEEFRDFVKALEADQSSPGDISRESLELTAAALLGDDHASPETLAEVDAWLKRTRGDAALAALFLSSRSARRSQRVRTRPAHKFR